ncbi:hypothetical protein BJF90_45545 [Pseudonocardia sp. CNS-004]|nr:hypothetical protein BJF90_45545 [Pseudonocardia sp. CNS-004]
MTYIELPEHLHGLPYQEQCRIRRAESNVRAEQRKADLHYNGVHVECTPKGRYGGNSWRSCTHAGTVERFHGHSFEGPLVCGCVEFSTAEGA